MQGDQIILGVTMSTQEPTLTDVLNELKSFQMAVNQRFEAIDQSFEAIDQSFEAIDQRFEEIDQRFDAMGQRFQEIDQRLDKLDYKFDTYEKASKKLLRLATTIIIAAATVAVLPSAFQAIGPLLTQIIAAGNN